MKLFARTPDVVIGDPADPYLFRWYVIPRNPWFNIYLHKIVRSDTAVLHDHPWWNCSIVLKGGYAEHTPGPFALASTRERWRGAGSLIFRRATSAHRLVIIPPRAPHAWTLFLTGPRVRDWGFHCPQGWVRWESFCATGDSTRVGAGCGEPETLSRERLVRRAAEPPHGYLRANPADVSR